MPNYEDWTEEEIRARIAEVKDELDELHVEAQLLNCDEDEVDRTLEDEISYLVMEGFIEVEEAEDGDFHFYPVADAEYIEIPI